MEKMKRKDLHTEKVLSLRSQDLEEADAIQFVDRFKVVIDFSENMLHSVNNLLQSYNFSKLRKLDLSNNKIDEIPNRKCLSSLTSLQVLYLHMNQIAEWKYLENFTAFPSSILHITLFCNPVVNRSGYRHFLVNRVRSLIALDLHVVTDEERSDTIIAQRPRFRALSTQMSFIISPSAGALTNSMLQIQEFNLQLYVLKRTYEKNSPSILIQKNYRGHVQRMKYQNLCIKLYNASTKIASVYRGWTKRKRLCFELPPTYLKYYLPALPTRYKNLVTIKKYLEDYNNHAKKQDKQENASNKIKRLLAFYTYTKKSYSQHLKLKEYPYLYFLKDQIKALTELLGKKLNSSEFNGIKFHLTQNKYHTIRIPDPEDIKNSVFPLIQIVRLARGMKLRRYNKEPLFINNVPISIYSVAFKKDEKYPKKVKVKQVKYMCSKVVEKLREKAILARQKCVYDVYSDLAYIEASPSIIKRVLESVLEYNREESRVETIGVYLPVLMKRNAAAVDIQAWYRGIRGRRILKAQLITDISRLRAALLIQRCWRWSLLKIRLLLLRNLKLHCAKITGTTLLIEEQLYLTLVRRAEDIAKTKPRIMEQLINFGFLNNKITAWYTVERDKAHPRYINNYLIPKWIPVVLNDFNEPPAYFNELVGLIHSTFSITELAAYCKLVDPKYKGMELSLSFVKFVCGSQEEARARAFLIALRTFNYRTKECIKFYTPEMLKDPINCAQHMKMWRAFNLESQTKEIERPLPVSSVETSEWPIIISHNPVPLLQLDCIKLRDSEVYSNAFGNVGTAADEIIDINDVFAQENMGTEEEHAERVEGEKITKKILYKELKKYKAQYIKKEMEELAEFQRQQKMQQLEEARIQAENQRLAQKMAKEQNKEIYEKQLNAFHKILHEEKTTIKGIIEKNREEQRKIKTNLKEYSKKFKMQKRKKEENREFCIGFMQIQNLISKQLRITDYQKRETQLAFEKKERVRELKRQYCDRSFKQEPLKITNLETVAEEKKLPAIKKYDLYMKKLSSDRKTGAGGIGHLGPIGELHRAHGGKKGKGKPAIFREELYPIVHRGNLTFIETNSELGEMPPIQ